MRISGTRTHLRELNWSKRTNHPISSNSYPPSKTKKQDSASIKEGVTNPTGTSYDFEKTWSDAPDGRSGKLFLIRDANVDKSQNSMYCV